MSDKFRNDKSHDRDKWQSEKAREEHIKQDKCSHQTGVAEYMRERADDFGVDGNIAYIIGHNHDIGYLEGRWFHEQTGAEMLRKAGFGEEICYAIEHHADDLAKLNEQKELSPYLVLLVEADMSVEMHGYRVGFDKRLADIEKRYGKDNNPQYDLVKKNIEFIKEYWAEHNIPTQDKVVHSKPTGKTNHGSGKWVGSELKAQLAKEYDERIEHAAFAMMQGFVFNRGTGAVFEYGGDDVTDEVKNPENDGRYFFDDTYYDYDLEQSDYDIHGANEIRDVAERIKDKFKDSVGSVDIYTDGIYVSMSFDKTEQAEKTLKENGYDWCLVGDEVDKGESMVITDGQTILNDEFGGVDDGNEVEVDEVEQDDDNGFNDLT